MERQELKQIDDFWNDSCHKAVKQNNVINIANTVYKFWRKLQCVKARR